MGIFCDKSHSILSLSLGAISFQDVGDHGIPQNSIFCFTQYAQYCYILLFFFWQLNFIQLHKLSMYVKRGLPLPLLPCILPVSVSSSKLSYLIMCPKNSSCLFLIIFKILRCVFAFCKTSMFDIILCSLYDIRNILLYPIEPISLLHLVLLPFE